MGPEPPAPEATREISANPVRNGGGGCVGGQGRSQYEARRGKCLVVFVGDKFLHICSTIRLTSILINIQVATQNTINVDVSRYYNNKHSNNL